MTWNELIELLKNSTEPEQLNSKREQIAEWLPCVKIMFEYDQNSAYHQYDLWMHSVHTLLGINESLSGINENVHGINRVLDDDMLYLAALLHDIGKPRARCKGKKEDDPWSHYYGHPDMSEQIVKEEVVPHIITKGICLPEEDINRLLYYVKYHDDEVSLKRKHLNKHLRLTDIETFKKLMILELADAKAHIILPLVQKRIDICSEWLNGRADSFITRNNENDYINYTFKRNYYYELEKAIDKSTFTVLLGPKKCGKTVALLQLKESKDNAIYYNLKSLTKVERIAVFDDIVKAMEEDRDIVFLVDEIIYANNPEKDIYKLAFQRSIRPCGKTKVVLTGGQLVALESWSCRAFCGSASIVRAYFLSYKEWLSYKGIKECTEASYNDFLQEIEDFHGIASLEDYLKECLIETMISNKKTDNAIIGNEIDLVNLDSLMNILYAILKEKYDELKMMDLNALKQSLVFLHKMGIIAMTPISDSKENAPSIHRGLSASYSSINCMEDLFKSFEMHIKHPIFSVEM